MNAHSKCTGRLAVIVVWLLTTATAWAAVRMKNTRVLTAVAIVMAAAVFLTAIVAHRGRHGPKDVKDSASVVLLKLDDGSMQEVEATRWPEPFVVQYQASESNVDFSEPKCVVDALWSTPNRDPDKYLTLLDPGACERVRQVDRESGGKLLARSLKGEPFPGPEKLKTFFTHYVDVTRGGKKYRILVGGQVIDGVEYRGLTVTLVQSDGRWLGSFDLDWSPLLTAIALRPFNDLLKSHAERRGQSIGPAAGPSDLHRRTGL